MRSRNKRKSDAEHNTSLSCSSRIIQTTGRKDRHSKVSTVKGPKDRRLRLSPKTAIQFYDVQDRLGFDRPSEAIEWLMREAKDAIDALNSRDDDDHHRHNPPADQFASYSFDFEHLDDRNCEQMYGQENHPSSDFSFFVDEDHVSSSYVDQRGMIISELDANNWDCCNNEVGIPSLGHDQMFPRREQFHSVDTEAARTYCQDTVDVSNGSTDVDGCSTQGHDGNC